MNDDFGNRMKGYESAFTSVSLNPQMPVYARLDGRSFSSLTRDMHRPYDERMSQSMIEVTKMLVAETNALIGYTQSDEISLVWQPAGPVSQMLFDGKLQKLCSVLAAMASTELTMQFVSRKMKKYAERKPHFDCRVLNIPNRSEATNMFLWRTQDASRNAISMAASAQFSHKQLQGVSTNQRLQMLVDAGIDFESYPEFFKHGTFVKRFVREVPVTEEMVANIPLQHRPEIGSMVTRSFIEEFPMPKFGLVKNREGVIFGNEEPFTGWS